MPTDSTTPDHDHACRGGCGGTAAPCFTPNDDCNDHPGDCADCEAPAPFVGAPDRRPSTPPPVAPATDVAAALSAALDLAALADTLDVDWAQVDRVTEVGTGARVILLTSAGRYALTVQGPA